MESVKASILFQENVLIQTKPSFGDILRGGLCEQCPFFYCFFFIIFNLSITFCYSYAGLQSLEALLLD